MLKPFCLLSGLLALTLCAPVSAANSTKSSPAVPSPKELAVQLAAAQRAKNQSEVEHLATRYITLMGDQAGIPETPDLFRPFTPQTPALKKGEIPQAFEPYRIRLQNPKEAWWTRRPGPAEIPGPLRGVASMVTGALAARRAGCDHPDDLLAIARGAADYLLWAQAQGGRGVFPFPDLRGKSGRLPELTERALARAEKEGVVDRIMKNGWIVDDRGGGDLQFDNGLCGAAMLEIYDATHEAKYLASARAAADWALAFPVVTNWNYNSFSVFLLAEMYRTTHEAKYLEGAKEKARLGIYPGQLKSGPRAGRWADPHNARLVYHFILCRGLGALLSVLPEKDPDRPRCRETLELALSCRTDELLKKGIANPETTLEVLARLAVWFPKDDKHLADCGRAAALDLLGRYVSEGLRRGKLAVPPNAWGLCLESRK